MDFEYQLTTEQRISNMEGQLKVLIGLNALNFIAVAGLFISLL